MNLPLIAILIRAEKVVILNILHHLFSSGNDVNDRVYISSKAIIEKYKAGIEVFMQKVGDLANLSNYPAHVEVRIDEAGKVTPIEINPMRFGGWCTTADLTWFCLWGSIPMNIIKLSKSLTGIKYLKENKILILGLIVLDNSTGMEMQNIESFNYDKLMQNFKTPIHLRKVDYQKYLVFGFPFCGNSK